MYATDPKDSVVPIFAKRKFEEKLVQVGTGIFIDYLSQPFLFTAAHVTDELQKSQLMVPVCGDIRNIQGYAAYIDLPPEIHREDDNVDIAYYKLSTDFARMMCTHFKPLPQSRRMVIQSALELGVCSVYGYPSSKAKLKQGVYTSESATFRGVAAREVTYSKLGLSPEHSIVVHFHKKRAVSPESKKRINPISPRGVSGGGIFSWPKGREISNDWSLPKLVGIFHTYKKSEGLMIGTHLIAVLAAIELGQMKGFNGVV